jgi:hypothetical protein
MNQFWSYILSLYTLYYVYTFVAIFVPTYVRIHRVGGMEKM